MTNIRDDQWKPTNCLPMDNSSFTEIAESTPGIFRQHKQPKQNWLHFEGQQQPRQDHWSQPIRQHQQRIRDQRTLPTYRYNECTSHQTIAVSLSRRTDITRPELSYESRLTVEGDKPPTPSGRRRLIAVSFYGPTVCHQSPRHHWILWLPGNRLKRLHISVCCD